MIYKISEKDKPKRYHLSKERLKDLKDPESLYIIRCVIDNCSEGHPTETCMRGFFSLFLQAVQGLHFCDQLNIPCYIDFGHAPMLYSDPERFEGDPNFWNYYFYQPVENDQYNYSKKIVNSYFETYPLRIWDRHYIKNTAGIIKKYIKFKNPVIEAFNQVKDQFSEFKILGVHIRQTDHMLEISPVHINRIIKTIKYELDYFDKVFISTDESEIIHIFKKTFGSEKIIYNSATRSENSEPVHQNMDLTNRYKLGLEALIDVYSLSLCKKAILMHSNFSFACLLFNPDLPYVLLENRDTKIKRLQTQLLYRLHLLGIRTL